MTKNEIIEKTLKDMSPLEPDEKAIIVAELQSRLPATEIKTCNDFKHLNAACCTICHTFFAHLDMKIIELPNGSKAWVCDPVEWAIYPERFERLQDWIRNTAEGKGFREIFGDNYLDDPSSEQQ